MLAKVNLNVNVMDDDIECIIEMAGYGIGYWCSEAVVKERGYDIRDDEDSKWYELNYEDILKGIELYILNGNQPYNIIFMDEENGKLFVDSGNIDAEVADSIIQYACFGKIIYG
jgi:hypothetical protein